MLILRHFVPRGALFWLVTFLLPSGVSAIMQTGAVDVSLRDGTTYTLLSSQASFGKYPEEGASKNDANRLMTSPLVNRLLCDNVITDQMPSLAGATVLVPRGSCSFETKAWNAQQLGAAGIIVYGNLGSRYSLNETKAINNTDYIFTEDDIIFPKDLFDYDCSRGSAQIPASSIQMKPLPYNYENNDPVLSGSSNSNLCRAKSEDELERCPSGACLLTGEKDGDDLQACCAWDFHVWLYDDPAFDLGMVTIPATYLTRGQAERILSDLKEDPQVYVTISSRVRPDYNFSSILIWILGVTVAALAAFMSAGDYHRMIRRVMRKQQRGTGPKATSTGGANDAEQEITVAAQSSSPCMQVEETLELTVWHAVGFVVMASSGLLILFFFKIYRVVKVFYAFGCSKAVSQIVFLPLFWRVAQRMNYKDRIVWRTGTEDFGDISVLDMVSHAFGFSLGLAWLTVCFAVRHPEQIAFYWIMQNIFGAAMCISFLAVIKLNSLKVAASLLTMAFFYDIFMVFISPLFFGKSVMITVATSGGPPTADPAWCEKYPDDLNCQGGEPLPMLFQIPRLWDYQGGSSLLGLGDIVLPGLLVSLAARLDAAKSLLGLMGGGNGAINSYGCPEQRFGGRGCSVCSGGYFFPSVVAYAVGLLMANMAVYLMNMGQPALLYLVPCCLGTMSFMAWRRNEFWSLWEGPRAIRTVDELLYGPSENGDAGDTPIGHAPIPLEEGEEGPSVPSALDAAGDLPSVFVQDAAQTNAI